MAFNNSSEISMSLSPNTESMPQNGHSAVLLFLSSHQSSSVILLESKIFRQQKHPHILKKHQ